MAMDIAVIGLGKMGANMARRLIKGRHRVAGMDRAAEAARTKVMLPSCWPPCATSSAAKR
jgi:3-hydroxyisobutyrate dehydrogenase-like beta-hydroxyacid dehydrogenase